jgi:hypothetical protein
MMHDRFDEHAGDYESKIKLERGSTTVKFTSVETLVQQNKQQILLLIEGKI